MGTIAQNSMPRLNRHLQHRPIQAYLPALLLIASVASIPFLSACSRSKAEAPEGPPVTPVKVQRIGSQEIGDTSDYVATIKSRNSATIMSDVEGWISAIHVKSGDRVTRGQSLIEIDPRRQAATVSNWESQRASKEANLQWAKLQLDRAKSLSASGVMSKQDFDQAQSTYDGALADVKSLDAQITQQQVQLRYFSVFAPVDGIVGDVPVHVGDRVTNTTVLTTIDERRGLEVYLQVPSERAKEVKLGAPVQVLDGEGKPVITTRVDFISPQVDTVQPVGTGKGPC